MEGEFPVGEAVHLHDQGRPEDLLGGHAVGAAFFPFQVSGKVLVNQVEYGIVLFQDSADGLQLPGSGVVDHRGRQRHLFFALFAHFVSGPFFLFGSGINVLQL